MLVQLLDPLFGLLLWAVHFLVVYVAAAVACVLGLGAATEGEQTTVLIALALITLAAAALTIGHALRRYRQLRERPEQHFRMSVTIGCDAIGTVAILWQLFALFLVPTCA